MRPRFLVLGAGPSGLVAAKTLKEHEFQNEKVDVVVIEEGLKLGGTFVNKTYEGSSLVSSKYITCFSDFREDETCEDHPSIPDYVDYLERYATQFDIHKLIRFGTRVINITSSVNSNKITENFVGVGSRKYKVTMMNIENGKTFIEIYDAVAVCSGLHNIPRVPRFKDQQNFRGVMFHTSQYKSAFELKSDTASDTSTSGKQSMFEGKKVLVVGCGETSFDIAFDAAKHNASRIAMLTRHGFVSVPTSFPGTSLPPLDCLIMNVGTHGYESHWAAKNNFHWWLTTKIQRLALLAMGGSSYGLNQWAGRRYNMSWDRGNKHIVNKSAKCMGLINRPVKKTASFPYRWLNHHLYSGWDKQSEGIGPEDGVHLYHPYEIVAFDSDGRTVHLRHIDSGQEVKYEADVVVLATGYVQQFPFIESTDNSMAEEEEPKDSPLPSEHFILDPGEPTIAYLGFIRPNVGSIPPMAELQTMWWCTRLKHIETQHYQDHRHLTPSQQREKARLMRRRRLFSGSSQSFMPGPRSKPYYKLDGSRLSYAVDYGTYMFALAREMEAVPDLSKWLWKNPRVFASIAFGQAHAPLFRLDGPYAIEAAESICANELIKPIVQRPLFMNAAFTVNAVFFASVNITASTLSRLWRYSVEDFIEDCIDLKHDTGGHMKVAREHALMFHHKLSLIHSKLSLMFDVLIYQPYFSEYFHDSEGGKIQADWLALWLASKSKSQVALIPGVTNNSFNGSSESHSSSSNDKNNIAERLKDITKLYREGVLTDEEFSAAKKKILS